MIVSSPGSGAGGGGTSGILAASLSGNTAGVLALISSGTMILAGGNNLTLSQNGQSITFSAGGGTGIAASLSGNTAGVLALVSTGTINLAGGNNITLSQNGQSITISAANISSHAISLSGNTSGALALISTGTAIFAGGNNITLSQNGQSVTISGGGGTLSLWEPIQFNAMFTATKAMNQSTLSMFPLYVPQFLSGTQFINLLSVSISSSSNSSFAAALSGTVGIYTLTGSTLNLLTASSGATNIQFSNTSNNSFNSLTGLKSFTFPLTMNATPGNYWLALIQASASTNANWASFSPVIGSANNVLFGGQIGEVAAATKGPIKGVGFYSVATGALPSAIGLSELTASTMASIQQLYMNFQGV